MTSTRASASASTAPTKVGPPPTAAPTDGPADLDAKADILADQSRRIRAQADALGRRAADAKSRQELRRRAADLDRDPFAPMEGLKRRIASSAGGRVTPAGAQTPPTPLTPNVGGQSAGVTGASNKNGTDSSGSVAPPTVLTPNAAGSAPLSTQLRDLLDPATLTDIRRLETAGTAGGSPQALERAAAALRARAEWLDGQSRAMRAKAQAK